MRKLRRSTSVLLATLAAGSALAGCTPGGATGAAAPSSSAGLSDVEILALGKEVAQCIRDNGVPGLPDPVFENGELTLPPVDPAMEEQGQAALDGPCRSLAERLESALPQKPGQDENEPRQPMAPEDLAKLEQYTKCMREHGFPAWPDPDPTGEYHLSGTGVPEGMGKSERPEDKTFRDALMACEPFVVPGMGITN